MVSARFVAMREAEPSPDSVRDCCHEMPPHRRLCVLLPRAGSSAVSWWWTGGACTHNRRANTRSASAEPVFCPIRPPRALQALGRWRAEAAEHEAHSGELGVVVGVDVPQAAIKLQFSGKQVAQGSLWYPVECLELQPFDGDEGGAQRGSEVLQAPPLRPAQTTRRRQAADPPPRPPEPEPEPEPSAAVAEATAGRRRGRRDAAATTMQRYYRGRLVRLRWVQELRRGRGCVLPAITSQRSKRRWAGRGVLR